MQAPPLLEVIPHWQGLSCLIAFITGGGKKILMEGQEIEVIKAVGGSIAMGDNFHFEILMAHVPIAVTALQQNCWIPLQNVECLNPAMLACTLNQMPLAKRAPRSHMLCFVSNYLSNKFNPILMPMKMVGRLALEEEGEKIWQPFCCSMATLCHGLW